MKSIELFSGIAALIPDNAVCISANSAFMAVNGYPLSITHFGGKMVSVCLGIQAIADAQLRRAVKRDLKAQGVSSGVGMNYLTFNIKTDIASPAASVYDELLRVTALLPSLGAAPQDGCSICGLGDTDAYMATGAVQGNLPVYGAVHQQCVKNRWTGAVKAVEEESGNYLTGIIGALLGAIVGCIPTVLFIWFADTISSLVCALIPICAFYGYKLFRGRMNAVAMISSIVFSVISGALAVCAYDIIDSMANYGYTFEEAILYMQIYLPVDVEYRTYFVGLLVQVLLFVALGIFISFGILRRTNKGKVKDLSGLRRTMMLKPGAQPVAFEDPAFDFDAPSRQNTDTDKETGAQP